MLRTFLTSLVFVIAFHESLYAIGKLGCVGIGISEFVFPGIASSIFLGEWDNAVFLGLPHYAARAKANEAKESEYYQEESNFPVRIELTEEEIDSAEYSSQYIWSQESKDHALYNRFASGFRWAAVYDIYNSGCKNEADTDTYTLMFSALRIDKFYDNWMFWAPLALQAYIFSLDPEERRETWGDFLWEDEKTDKKLLILSRGLTRDEITQDVAIANFSSSVGEEMFFRGVVQDYFFNGMKDSGFNPSLSRHLAILLSSSIFAIAHPPERSSRAFFFSVYYGYTYHPSLDEFDLVSAAALHAWTNIFVFHNTYMTNSKIIESEEDVEVPIFNIAFRF